MRSNFAATALAAAMPLALAQTSTTCNPTEKSCPADLGLPSASYSADFSSGSSANASWSAAAYTTITYGSDGAAFSIANENQAPTIQTDFYFLFGRVDVVMKASPGVGIISSIVLESDDLDEIDWEFLGGNDNQVQSNFYGKGNTTSYDRAEYHTVADVQGTWHTYSVDWTSEQLQWMIDGSVIRTLPFSTALTVNGQNYPQTPMRLKLGSWCGGCSSSEGTREWAGGNTTFDDAPYEMYVKSVNITNANPACSYDYSNTSGSWQSITINKSGDSCSAGAGSSSASAVGSATQSATSADVAAPTSSHQVVAISDNGNTFITATGTGASSSQPTGINGTSASGRSPTASGPTASSTITPSTGGAASLRIAAGGSAIGLVLAFFL